RAELISYTITAAAVCTAVILVRIVWVLADAGMARWRRWRVGTDGTPRYPSMRAAIVIAWCGMRGIVTLAAALALPAGSPDAPPFPYRDLILFAAFSVVLGTLVVQGMTLSPLMRALALEDDGSVEREVRLARAETARAALDAVDGAERDQELVGYLRRKYQA